MWEPIWASRFRYWLLTGDMSRSCLHCSRTRRVRTLNVTMTVLLWVYKFWCTEVCSVSQMWSRTWRGVSKWSRHKDWYIGSLCLDIGSVPGEIGILPEYREGYRNPPGAIWAIVGLSGKEKGLPIYQSLRLDHFETPRHVRDHIRDSKHPSVHQNA